MGLEAATFINQLVNSNPTGLDEVNKGDDHLRLVKSVLQNTFPSADAAILPTPVEFNLLVGLTAEASEINILDGALLTTVEINFVSGVTSGIQTQLDAITAAIAALFPIGHQLHSALSSNPSTYGYPGTWVQIAQGRTLIGEGTGGGLTTRVAGVSLGVEDSIVPLHNHTASQPAHNHTVAFDNSGSGSGAADNASSASIDGTFNTGNATPVITVDNEGVSPSDGNMQPSLVTYIWERTA